MKNTKEQAIEKTVDFWVEKSFRTPLNQNNGDDSQNGGMMFMLMNMVSSSAKETISEEKIDKFKSKMSEIMMNADPIPHYIDVDYHPCPTLRYAAEYANIDLGCFPCKTYSTINRETFEVKASYQYRGELVTL